VAALLAGLIDGDDETCAILSGGNIDPTLLMQVTRHGLTSAGRYLVVRTCVPDRPGELLKLLQRVAEQRVNVVSVSHRREGVLIGLGETEIELTLSTRDEAHCEAVLEALRGLGYPVDRLA
jgi:threonine dehydratase